MALTKVSGGILDPGINVAGIVTATGFDGPFTGGSGSNINAGIITATGFDLNGNGDISGNLVIGGNLTANGDFTTLNTTLREVEILRVDADTTATAGIITQRGSGDILNLFDNNTEVFKIADGGDTTFFGATSGRDIIFDRSENTLQVKANAILKIGQGSYSADVSTNGVNLTVDHNPISAIYLKTNDLQILGTGARSGVTYDGTLIRARTGVVELGHEVGNGGATGFKLSTVGYGVTVFGTTETQKLNVTGISTFADVVGFSSDVNVTGTSTFTGLVDINGGATVNGGLTSTLLTINGGASPVTINHTGGNALTLARSSKEISFNANYAASNTYANMSVTSGMDLRFTVGGRDGITIDGSNGYMGIDTNAPTAPLHIASNAAALKITRGTKTFTFNANYASGDSYMLAQLTSGMDLKFNLGGSDRIVFKSAGHIEPETAGAMNIGSASKEIGDVYIADDKSVYLGNGQDIRLLYDSSGSTSFTIDSQAGYMYINSDALRLNSRTSSWNYLRGDKSDGVVRLYKSNSQRLATSEAGITVTGEVATSQDYPNYRPTLDFNFAAEKKLDPIITYTRSGVATFVNEFGKVVKVGENVPRFDHDPITRECKGLLIEETRTNVAESSEDFDNTTHWEKYSQSVVTNVATAPDGTLTADNIIPSAGSSAARYLYFSNNEFPLATSTAYTTSIFVKKNGLRYFAFQAHDNGSGSGHRAGFDLDNGTVVSGTPNNMGSASGVSASIVEFPNGWFRCILTGTTAGSGSIGRTAFSFSSALNAQASVGAITADGTNGGYVWGHQVEAGAFVTSYIPTTSGREETRADDDLIIDGEDFTDFINPSEGTILADYKVIAEDPEIMYLSDGTAARRIGLYEAGSSQTRFLIGNSGTLADTTDSAGTTVGDNIKAAGAYKLNDVAAAKNGVISSTDTTVTIPPDLDRAYIGGYYDGSVEGILGLRRLVYYQQRLPNSQLVTLTA